MAKQEAMNLMEFMKRFDTEKCAEIKTGTESSYNTAWIMSRKIQKAMGDRDSLYILIGTVETDDSFFWASRLQKIRQRGLSAQGRSV